MPAVSPMQIRFEEIFPQEWKTYLPGMIGEIEDEEAARLIKAGIAKPFKVAEKKKETATKKSFSGRESRVGNK